MFAGIVALVLVGIWLFCIAPGHSEPAARAPFLLRTFAHRGLYKADQSVPENSLAAFLAAVHGGYGIELDVQLTADKRIVVFHDETLLRACGVDARVDDYTYEALRELSLFSTDHRIPLFSDVLSLIGGRVPIIVELKAIGDWKRLCADTYAQLSAYRGPACVESFHPLPVRWFYRNAPELLRGQLSEAYHYSRKWLPWYESFMMSRLLTNMYTRPQFIAYRIGPKCLSARVAEWLGAMRVCWTARPEHDFETLTRTSDAVIFENMRPGTHFAKGQTAAPILTELSQPAEPPATACTDSTG